MTLPTPADVDQALVDAARAVRANAWAPFSSFSVGAAVRHVDGRIFTGCNVENATYGLTICAERTAIVKAISEGARPGQFTAVVVVADTEEPTPPCGACRQSLAEFGAPSMPVASRTLAGAEARWTVAELLPHAFTSAFL